VQRVVVRNGMSMDLADALLDDIAAAVSYLDGLEGPLPRGGRKTTGFHH
jgi:glutamate decarboxylase